MRELLHRQRHPVLNLKIAGWVAQAEEWVGQTAPTTHQSSVNHLPVRSHGLQQRALEPGVRRRWKVREIRRATAAECPVLALAGYMWRAEEWPRGAVAKFRPARAPRGLN